MLAGFNCGDRVPAGGGPALLATAIALVQSEAFAFVGLVEGWDTSICLLHAMLGRGTRPMLGEMQSLGHTFNSRTLRGRGDGVGGCRLRSAAGVCFDGSDANGQYNESVLGNWHDELDDALYAVVVQVYRANLARHGIQSGARSVDSVTGAATRHWVVRREGRSTPLPPRPLGMLGATRQPAGKSRLTVPIHSS
jgi:hypothetical protein